MDLTKHLTARADDSHAAPSFGSPCGERYFSASVPNFQAQVRFLAYHRIKPHAPPLVRAPANSFEFHRCRRTPQVDDLSLSLCRSGLNTPNNKSSSFTAWTTRVSNPVCSPRFRASASDKDSLPAFAFGVLWHIYEFHLYLPYSSNADLSQVKQYLRQP